MASMGDQSFKQMLLFGKNLGGGGSLQNSAGKQLLRRRDGGVGGRDIFGRRKGLLDIDLNVAPPEEEDDGGEGEELQGGGAHCSKGENKTSGFDCLEEEAKMVENMSIGDDVKGKTETERRIRRWNAILRVAGDAHHDYEKNGDNNNNKSQNRKRRTIPMVELQKSPEKKKIPEPNGVDAEWLVAVAAAASAPPPLVRSTRGRAVAMPNKYRDSVLDVAAETAAFLRHNRICNKSAAVVSSKRKSR